MEYIHNIHVRSLPLHIWRSDTTYHVHLCISHRSRMDGTHGSYLRALLHRIGYFFTYLPSPTYPLRSMDSYINKYLSCTSTCLGKQPVCTCLVGGMGQKPHLSAPTSTVSGSEPEVRTGAETQAHDGWEPWMRRWDP